jgi:hypothetical protein
MLKAGGNDCFRSFPGAMPARFAHAPISCTNKLGQHSLRWKMLIAPRGDADSLAARR